MKAEKDLVHGGRCVDCKEYGKLYEWQSKKTKHFYYFCKKCYDAYVEVEN